MDPLPRFLARRIDLPVYFGVLLPGGSFRILQIAPAPPPYIPMGEESNPEARERYREMEGFGKWEPGEDGSVKADKLGRRYHRVLECLVKAHPTSWYGLTHRRF
jgi:hypothetical protein